MVSFLGLSYVMHQHPFALCTVLALRDFDLFCFISRSCRYTTAIESALGTPAHLEAGESNILIMQVRSGLTLTTAVDPSADIHAFCSHTHSPFLSA